MVFTSVNKSSQGSHAHKTEIRMGSRIQSEKIKTRSIYFSISQDIIEQLEWKIVDGSTDRHTVDICVLEGSMSDAGFIMLANQGEKVYHFGSTKGKGSVTGTVALQTFKHYVLNDVTQDITPEAVEFIIVDKDRTILIQCPDWLRYNPLSAPESELIDDDKLIFNQEVAIAVAHELLINKPKRKQLVTVHPNYDEDAPDVVIAPGKDANLPAMNRSERRVLAKKVAQAMPRSRR